MPYRPDQDKRGDRRYSEVLWHLERTREPLVELPSLGRPTPEERDWRRRVRPGREARAAALRAKTIEDWIAHLEGDDIPWSLRAVRYLKHILAGHEARVIRHAFLNGYGWDEIGSYLGVTRQAVARRWSDRLWQEISEDDVDAAEEGPDHAARSHGTGERIDETTATELTDHPQSSTT